MARPGADGLLGAEGRAWAGDGLGAAGRAWAGAGLEAGCLTEAGGAVLTDSARDRGIIRGMTRSGALDVVPRRGSGCTCRWLGAGRVPRLGVEGAFDGGAIVTPRTLPRGWVSGVRTLRGCATGGCDALGGRDSIRWGAWLPGDRRGSCRIGVVSNGVP